MLFVDVSAHYPDEVKFGMADSRQHRLIQPPYRSSAVNMAKINSLYRPIIVGYDSKEGYIPLLMPFVDVLALLHRRR